MAKRRAWCFTLSNYTEDEVNSLKNLPSSYMLFGYETCPTTGTPHLQGYVYFKHARSFEGVKKDIPRAHLEMAKGSGSENYAYCTKTGGEFYERGIKPLSQEEKGICEKRRWQDILAHAKAGDDEWLEENEPEVAFKHGKMVEHFAKKFQPNPENLPERKVHWWYYGVPNSGKSWAARQEGPHYPKALNKWWDGYQGEDIVVIDEFEPKHGDIFSDFLKKWADIYPFIAESKGGSKKIRPAKIIVTSNYTMEQCFPDKIVLAALKTRFNVKQFPFAYVSPEQIGFDY